jgi:PilZ domain-containing protein
MSLNVRKLRRPAGSGPSAGRRYRANCPAQLKAKGTRYACSLIDLSISGACIRLDTTLPKDAQLWLIVEGMPPVAAAQAWRKGDHLGLRFTKDQEWVNDSYQQRFDPAAWLKVEPKSE